MVKTVSINRETFEKFVGNEGPGLIYDNYTIRPNEEKELRKSLKIPRRDLGFAIEIKILEDIAPKYKRRPRKGELIIESPPKYTVYNKYTKKYVLPASLSAYMKRNKLVEGMGNLSIN